MDPLADAGELENNLQRVIDPDVAAQALQLASGAVRAFCKWDLSYVEDDTLQVDGSGTVVLTLPTLNLLSVDAIRVDGVTLDVTSPTSVSWSKKGQLYRPCGWPRFAVVEVDCAHGYNPIPDLLKLVTLDLAGRQANNPERLVSAQSGQVVRTWSSSGVDLALSPLHERLLTRYSL